MTDRSHASDATAGVELAKEIVVRIITLSSAIIALSGSLLSDTISRGAVQDWTKGFLVTSWSAFGLSILLGLLSLMSLAGLLAKAGDESPVIYKPVPRGLAIGSILTFLVGMVCFLVYLVGLAIGPEVLAP